MLERLQKFMSSAGVASRRHAEEMILAGQVRVNGKVIKELGTKVDPAKDEVRVNGKAIKPRTEFLYLAFNKPKRCVTTREDPRKRKTVFDFLPPELKNVVWPIGRLDFNSEGLLLFTNDGDLTQKLTHPSFEHEKEYEVKLDKELSGGRVEKIESGMIIDGKKTSPAKLRMDGTTVYLTIHEGMNRQVRKMFGELGYSVRNLKRIRIGKLKLGNIPSGQFMEFDPKQVL
jgi:23S rRNA pseudouridine2605 synthase